MYDCEERLFILFCAPLQIGSNSCAARGAIDENLVVAKDLEKQGQLGNAICLFTCKDPTFGCHTIPTTQASFKHQIRGVEMSVYFDEQL